MLLHDHLQCTNLIMCTLHRGFTCNCVQQCTASDDGQCLLTKGRCSIFFIKFEL